MDFKDLERELEKVQDTIVETFLGWLVSLPREGQKDRVRDHYDGLLALADAIRDGQVDREKAEKALGDQLARAFGQTIHNVLQDVKSGKFRAEQEQPRGK